MKKKIGVFIPATLGMLTAFGPFVTDFYLPVLPEMSEFFHTSPALASPHPPTLQDAERARKEERVAPKRGSNRDKKHIYVNNIPGNTYSPEMLEKRGIKRFKIFP